MSDRIPQPFTPVGFYCDHSDEPDGQRTHHDWEWVEGEGHVFTHKPDTISAHMAADQRYLKPEKRGTRCSRALPVYTEHALLAEVQRLKAEVAKRPSRYSATPAEIDDYLRRHLTEEVVLNFQRAIGNRAVEEAAKDIRMESHTPLASELYLNGMKFAADHIDPLKGGGYYPSSLLCSKHNGFGQCPGAPWCTPRDEEAQS
ncbi:MULTISPECIES: hypothetical protein [unclassified Streptomyces]|uniref:hypothetical protein n=1 Tax=unclassified Streptomyces TaxID=2593676 RepID=UPI00278BD21D|nr:MULTISPECIES: hypothetical protein [unclassified Streptomyces]